MSNFNKAYDLIIEDIIQSVTPEELKDRQKEYPKIVLKTFFDKFLKANRMIKNEDGTYDINDDVHLESMNLTSLLDLPYKIRKINGTFNCSYNGLTNLEGLPIITKHFNCSFNKLTSLEGCPKKINGTFMCNKNSLTSLKGCPNIITSVFNCAYNPLIDLEGCPKIVEGDFYIYAIIITPKKSDIRKICTVGGNVIV